MGRRGRTGAGGAVVSSLSTNSGGTVKGKKKGSRSKTAEDPAAEFDFALDTSKKKKKNGQSSGTYGGSSSAERSENFAEPSEKRNAWLGKSPIDFVREWCLKNNRKRPYFAKMERQNGFFRCVIPPGTKDGKKSGKAKVICGVGEQPGEDFAALNLLHQIENGKPMERLLAPEYRELWLDMDKRFAEMEKDNQARAVRADERKKKADRRTKIDNDKETISISTASRQMIEDALLETNVLGRKATPSHGTASLTRASSGSDMEEAVLKKLKQTKVKAELIRLGFSELDSDAAGNIFSELNDALDYLCLNLDESELPKAFTPTADIEVVQFYSKESAGGLRKVEQKQRDMLAEKLCVSRYSAEKALKVSNGNELKAFQLLYQNLTRAKSPSTAFDNANNMLLNRAEEERNVEAEAMEAIYGEDAKIGVGVVDDFVSAWAAVVRFPNGAQGLRHKGPLCVAVVDVDGCYPFSVPVVFVTDADANASSRERLTPPQKRAATRALFSVISALRSSHGVNGIMQTIEEEMCAQVVHEVVSFLQNATPADIMKAAVECQIAGESDDVEQELEPSAASASTAGSSTSHMGRRHRVASLRPAKPLPSSSVLQAMTQKRKSLPAFQSRGEVLQLLHNHQVIVVSGATGSGKTTQVPQYILENAMDSASRVSIVCTQPRRIAAVSVAERVASERGEEVGGTVGFQVKLHSKKSRRTRLMFCTTGVLLRRLQSDPTLEAYTHVLVDEVHERSVETDFLLLLLRDILRKRPSLRLVLMSATLDADKFSQYFANTTEGNGFGTVPVVDIPGRTFPVDERYLEDCVSLTGYRLTRNSRYAKRTWKEPQDIGPQQVSMPQRKSATAAAAAFDPEPPTSSEDEGLESIREGCDRDSSVADTAISLEKLDARVGDGRAVSLPIAYSVADRDTIQQIDESVVNVDLINALVRKIDLSAKDDSKGAILVFLPGAADISSVVQQLCRDSGSARLWPLPLHSLLSPDEQAQVFMKPPKGKRKVICASNIAETSITVEDVTVVIDTLKEKEMSFDALNNTSVLQEQFISKAAARQRAGRAGRVAKGTCYRLVRRHTFDNKLSEQQTPEIQRVSLEHVILNFLSIARGIDDSRNPHAFLARAMDPPEKQAITSAISSLVELGALRRLERAAIDGHDVELTALGMHLTGLPVDVRIGKLLIFGVLLNCVDASLTIAASISERSPFISPFNKREEARRARDAFAWGKSDLLTYVRAYNKWREVRSERGGFSAEREFCEKNFLSRKTLWAIHAQRTQLASALHDAGFGIDSEDGESLCRSDWVEAKSINENSENARVVKAMVCAALYPNIMRIDSPNATYREVIGGAVQNNNVKAKDLKFRARGGERLFLHPSSVNFHEGNYASRWLAYFSKVKTTRVFVRDATMVSPYAVLLFGGEINVLHERGEITMDGWMYFKAPARVAVLVREVRRQLDVLLQRKFENPELNLNEDGRGIHDAITRLIKTES